MDKSTSEFPLPDLEGFLWDTVPLNREEELDSVPIAECAVLSALNKGGETLNLVKKESIANELLNYFKRSFSFMRHSLAAFLLAIAIWFAAAYILTITRTSKLQDTISDLLRKNVPELRSALPGKELITLQGLINQLNNQLTPLESAGDTDPLVVLDFVIKTFPKDISIEMRSLSLLEGKVTLEGYTQKYRDIDNLKEAFEKQGSLICKVEDQSTSRYGASKKWFKLVLHLCKRSNNEGKT